MGGPNTRSEGRKRGYLFLSFFQLCWDLDSGCIHIQLQLLLGDSFMVSGIPGLQEHHSFPCLFRLRVVTASCCCKPLCASISFAVPQISANNLFIKVSSCHLSCFFHTLIYSVSEKLRQHLKRPEQIVFSRTQSDLLMKYIVYNENFQKEDTQIKFWSHGTIDYHRCDIERSTMMREGNNIYGLRYLHS